MNLHKTVGYLFLIALLYTTLNFTMESDWELVESHVAPPHLSFAPSKEKVNEIVSHKTIPEKLTALSNYLKQVLESLEGESNEGDTVSH